MRTTIDIDIVLLKRLRAEAARKGVPFKEVVAGALRRGLDVGAGTAKPMVSSLPTFSMGEPMFDIDKARYLAAALEDERVLRDLRGHK